MDMEQSFQNLIISLLRTHHDIFKREFYHESLRKDENLKLLIIFQKHNEMHRRIAVMQFFSGKWPKALGKPRPNNTECNENKIMPAFR